jgi:Na+/proline symporter
MVLTSLDWLIILSFLLFSLGIGLYYKKAAGKSISNFFLGGRNLPWYIAGLSMVATTFAADTPLAVSELVAQGGIAKNWLWWSFIFGGALTTFFFATFWRRANILTELEFIQLRYEGRPARYLRLFKSVYLGLFMNAIIIAWVNLAMQSLLEVFFGLDSMYALFITIGMMVLALFYAALSGLKGVAITDAFQFTIAMVGCIILAVLVIQSDEVGGMDALKSKLPEGSLSFVPSLGTADNTETGLLQGFGLTIGAFLAFIGVQWWASWYPGAEPGGGGYIAQRMMSTKNEQGAVWATLLFQVGHYCLRPWPWIIVALCAIVLYQPTGAIQENLTTYGQPFEVNAETPEALIPFSGSGIENKEDFLRVFPDYQASGSEEQVTYHYEPRMGFVMAMRDYLPNGLRGLLLVAFIAAYMSTISTQINWGASYLVNDLLLPLYPTEDNQKLIAWSRWASVFIMIIGASITPLINSISGVWAFIMQCGAGLGLVLILRWYWWRINAWSEISATVAPLLAYAFCYFYLNDALGPSFEAQYGSFYVTVGFTTVVWMVVTFLTRPPGESHIKAFMQRIRPLGWWPAELNVHQGDNRQLKWLSLNWVAMISFIIASLFGLGKLILLEFQAAIVYLSIAILSALALRVFLKKTNIFERN